MRFLAAAVLTFATAAPCFAQGLFDDNEARRRVEACASSSSSRTG